MPQLQKRSNGRDSNNQVAVQEFIKSQIYMLGFAAGVTAGQNPISSITSLGGAARWLYGITIYVQNSLVADDDTFSLSINNEQIINTAIWRTFCPSYNLKLDQFFRIPRPLSGSDTLQISWNAVNNKTIYPTFYLSNKPPKNLNSIQPDK